MSEADLYRPKYHFTPKKNWMNDPNGLVYVNGKYHLFFQHNPFAITWGHMHWGHAVSTDLLNWEELPIAISEDEDGTIFSGSAVYDENNTAGFGKAIVAIYTANKTQSEDPKQWQGQSIAYSLDDGLTFTKYLGNPVIDRNLEEFRDPKVFWHEDRWVMIVAISIEQKIAIYSSLDLKKWELQSESLFFAENEAKLECPDLFPLELNGKRYWVLILSYFPHGIKNEASTKYIIGNFDGKSFEATSEPTWMDWGPNCYAGVTYNNTPDGKRIFIAWMKPLSGAVHPGTAWTGSMTVPRELSLIEKNGTIQLVQQPICPPSRRLTLGVGETISGSVDISFDGRLLHFEDYSMPVTSVDGKIEIDIWLDSCSIEIIADQGTKSLSATVFPKEGIPII